MRHPLHDHQGDPPRRGGAGGAPGASRSRSRRCSTPRAASSSSGQGPRRRAAHHRGVPARHRAIDGLDADRGTRFDARLPERVRGRLARRRAAGHDARPHLRARQRVRRGDRHRDAALRPARDGRRAARARRPPHAEGPRARRPARLRLRPRLPLGVRQRRAARPGVRADGGSAIDVGGTNTDAVLARGRRASSARGQDPDHRRTSPRASSRALAGCSRSAPAGGAGADRRA